MAQQHPNIAIATHAMFDSNCTCMLLQWLAMNEDTPPEEAWWSAWIGVAVLAAMTIHIHTMRALRRHHAQQRSMEQQLVALLTAIENSSSTKCMQLDIGVNVHGGVQSIGTGSMSGDEGSDSDMEHLHDGDAASVEHTQ